ncbi:Ribosomal N-lysine methyltransferase-like protein, partial [Tolypocladium capitatum]
MGLVERLTTGFGGEPIASRDLGFVDAKASSVDVTVGGREYTVHQSPAMLSSTRAGGTTGAVLWTAARLFADYLASPRNAVVALLPPRPSVLELGCGVSPLAALALRPVAASYVLSDQPY